MYAIRSYYGFGVSRKTVRLAIKGLVEDNFLTTKQGVGTFTNPLWDDSQVIKLPVVGIITTDGKNTTVNPVNMGIFEAIIQNGMNCELLFVITSYSIHYTKLDDHHFFHNYREDVQTIFSQQNR